MYIRNNIYNGFENMILITETQYISSLYYRKDLLLESNLSHLYYVKPSLF